MVMFTREIGGGRADERSWSWGGGDVGGGKNGGAHSGSAGRGRLPPEAVKAAQEKLRAEKCELFERYRFGGAQRPRDTL